MSLLIGHMRADDAVHVAEVAKLVADGIEEAEAEDDQERPQHAGRNVEAAGGLAEAGLGSHVPGAKAGRAAPAVVGHGGLFFA